MGWERTPGQESNLGPLQRGHMGSPLYHMSAQSLGTLEIVAPGKVTSVC